MPPTVGNTGRHNVPLEAYLVNGNDQYQLGEAFDSSTACRWPMGGDGSPDIAWDQREY